jgi:hypothetical protein
MDAERSESTPHVHRKRSVRLDQKQQVEEEHRCWGCREVALLRDVVESSGNIDRLLCSIKVRQDGLEWRETCTLPEYLQ